MKNSLIVCGYGDTHFGLSVIVVNCGSAAVIDHSGTPESIDDLCCDKIVAHVTFGSIGSLKRCLQWQGLYM